MTFFIHIASARTQYTLNTHSLSDIVSEPYYEKDKVKEPSPVDVTQRLLVIKECLATEKSYLEDLDLLIKVPFGVQVIQVIHHVVVVQVVDVIQQLLLFIVVVIHCSSC